MILYRLFILSLLLTIVVPLAFSQQQVRDSLGIVGKAEQDSVPPGTMPLDTAVPVSYVLIGNDKKLYIVEDSVVWKTFNGDPTLANACREALKFYKKLAETDVPKLTDFYLKEENWAKTKKSFEAKSASSRTQADIDAYNKGVNEFNEAVNTFNKTNNVVNKDRTQMLNNWEVAQKKFADANMPYYKG